MKSATTDQIEETRAATPTDRHDHYSVDRMLRLKAYSEDKLLRRSLLRVAVLAPVPSLALLTLAVVITHPSLIVKTPTAWAYGARAVLTVMVLAATTIVQLQRCVPSLPTSSPFQLSMASLVIALGGTGAWYGLSKLGGETYGMSFALMLPGYLGCIALLVVMKWRKRARGSGSSTLRNFTQLLVLHSVTIAQLVVVTPVHNHWVARTDADIRIWVALILPCTWVLALWALRTFAYKMHGVSAMIATVTIGFEATGPVLTSSLLKYSSGSLGPAIVAVNVLSAAITTRDLWVSFRSVLLSRKKIKALRTTDSVVGGLIKVPTLDTINTILNSNEAVRQHPAIALAGSVSRQQHANQVIPLAWDTKKDELDGSWAVPTGIAPKGIATLSTMPSQRELTDTTSTTKSLVGKNGTTPEEINRDKLRYVHEVLHLLHHSDRVALLQLTNTMIPLTYGLESLIVYYIFNHDARLMETHVLGQQWPYLFVCAALHGLLFVVVALTIRMRTHISMLHQLAMVLQSEGLLIQLQLVASILVGSQYVAPLISPSCKP